MFVGVIQEVGQVKEKTIENNKINIYIQANMLPKELEIGNEVNINGLLFVVNEMGENYFKGTGNLSIMVNENLENLEAGSPVNLEKEVQPYRYKGSHVISGNINNIGEVIEISQNKDHKKLRVKTIKDLHDYFKENKSIAINGVSLTINKLVEDEIVIKVNEVIWQNTNLRYLNKGDKINIETDIVGRYIGQIMDKQEEIIEKKEIIKENLLNEDEQL